MILSLIGLLLLSAIFSGLTIGMFSLNPDSLARKAKNGNKMAEKVLAVRKKGNRLLCTLLLSNTAINSLVSVLLGEMASGAIAVAVSTISIFLFGELLPQAIFSKYPLQIGSRTAWLVKIFMFIMSPLAYPISYVLNKWLGEDFPDRYDRNELNLLIDDHSEHSGGPLDKDEQRILKGAMVFSDKEAKQILTPINMVFRLQENVILNDSELNRIKTERYSRIPVYSDTRDDIVGILFAKDLIGYDPKTAKLVGELCVKDKVLFVRENIKLDKLLNLLIDGKMHLAFVYDQNNVLLGLVSLEDVIEEIIDKQIMDETDTDADLQHLARTKEIHVIDNDD